MFEHVYVENTHLLSFWVENFVGGGVRVRGGGIKVGCCLSGTGTGMCTLGSCGQYEQGTKESGEESCSGDFAGTLGNDAGANFLNDGIGRREIVCLCGKRGNDARGAYMLKKNLRKLF